MDTLSTLQPSRRVTLLAAVLALPAADICAQTAEIAIEEILISADFRNENLMTSVGSASVITADSLQQRAAQHLEDVLSAAPNVSWSTGASRSRFVQIRGVGDLEQYAEPKYYPSVGIMLDDLELGSSASAGMLFDVEQVEILRGPQGTRFGASAHAGMVKIKTNDPIAETQATLAAGFGNYDSYHVGAVINGSITDTLTGRLAIQQNESDGHIENDRLGRDDTNGFDELTARLKLRWQPTDKSTYDFMLMSFYSDNGYDTYSLDNDRTTQSDQPGTDQVETLALTAKADWLLEKGRSLQVSVGHQNTQSLYGYDGDWVSPEFCIAFICSGGSDTAQEIFDRDREQTTLDIRLLGGTDTRQYVFGLYANKVAESLDYAYPSVWYGNYASNSQYDTDRFAAYGEIDVTLTDRLSLSAGARVEHFEEDYKDSNSVSHSNSDTFWNGELSAEFQLSDTTFTYATLALANKPGGVNVSASSQFGFMSSDFQTFMSDNLAFDKETLISQEVGIKSQLLDSRLQLRAALFHAERQNAQLENWMWDGAAGLWIGYLDSASDATNYGLEVESSFQVNETFRLFANAGLLRTEVDTVATFDLDLSGFVIKDDRDQTKSPEYQYSVGVEARLTNQLSAKFEVEGRDESFFGYYHDGKLDGYELLNASLTWQSEKLTVNLWGKNLADEEYATHALYFGADPRDDFGAWGNQTYSQLGAPRTVGVNVTYSL